MYLLLTAMFGSFPGDETRANTVAAGTQTNNELQVDYGKVWPEALVGQSANVSILNPRFNDALAPSWTSTFQNVNPPMVIAGAGRNASKAVRLAAGRSSIEQVVRNLQLNAIYRLRAWARVSAGGN